MTQQFENMLYLFGKNANGAEVKLRFDPDVEEIRKYSIEQGIWTMVYPELAKICDASRYKQEFLETVSVGVMRKEFTLGTIRKLEENGIRCCILKGTMLSQLYKDPECRISGDTDILIDPKDEAKAKKVLKELGYEIGKREKNNHHLKAYHKKGGLLEVHIMLYGHTTSEILFNGLNLYGEEWNKTEIGGYEYHILGVNDCLMHLTAHYIKHLINEGGGVRQMMDLLLYIEKYADKIDFERYDRLLKELHYDKLIDVIRTVGGKYFGFNYEIKDEELAKKVLTDSETGGIFGHETDERKHFYDDFCKKRTTMSKYRLKIFSALKSEISVFDKFFPSRERMINIYGYNYAKKKVLLPIAWLNHYFNILTGRRKVVPDKRDTAEFKSRMQLMRDLGMIEKE